jgi:A/G-specific adenine glycosylase
MAGVSLRPNARRTEKQTSAAGIPAREWPSFRRSLLKWFRHNKRDMPWRRVRDPYRVWLSEIMLQQTRVAAVIPYFERFLGLFPTVRHLANASEASVLSAWSGLGYYSRARNLHRAARRIIEQHDGEFPQDREQVLQLPGIGEYTSAAILSIAYEQPHAALDGNVARVLARLGALRGDLRTPDTWRRLGDHASLLLARHTPGEWNEAMMELGATVCTPVSPLCEKCPVARWCRARALGIAAELPTARKKSAPVRMTVAALVLLDPQKRTLLIRQPNGDGAIFARLWQFPAEELRGDERTSPREIVKSLLQKEAAGGLPIAESSIQQLPAVRHSVTFREIRLLPFLVRVPRLPKVRGARAVLLELLGGVAVSSGTRKIARAAFHAKT